MRLRTALPCVEALELMEPGLDGDLPATDKARLDAHLGVCAGCAEELAWALEVRRGVESLPRVSCPPEVAERIRERARRHAQRGHARLTLRSIAPLFFPRWRPIGAVVLAAALVSALGLLRPGPAPIDPEYSAADLARAEAEARHALAYFAALSRQAGLTLRDDVLGQRVSQAPRTALDLIEGR